MELLEYLHDPGREYSPVPFWFLNGDLTHRSIRAQLADFHAHGVYGVVLHPRMGLAKRIRYLSPVFFSYIRTAVETAAELGMTVVFYDEGMYPSGSANGQVVAGHPELASQGLALAPQPLPGDEVLARTADGVLTVRPSGGTIRGVHWGEDDGEPGAPLSADILNPDAVRRFIELTHEAYYREFKDYFGSTVLGFFTDEPSVLGRNTGGMVPWTRGFAELFTASGGDLSGLAALFRGEENQDTRLYRDLILKRENEVYYGALSAWCEAHGVALMGHPDRSDDIERERYFHIPGQDLVYRFVAPERGGLSGDHSTMAKCSADAARLMGRRRNSNECFGACNRDDKPWYLTGGDIKWFLDWLAVRGVNLFIPHAFYYSVAGKRKDERPPDVGPHSIWWPHYGQWSLYMRRLSCLMTDADLHADVAVLCRNRELAPELVSPLFQRQTGFQYLPESVWPECREENGALFCRGRRYGAVLGPGGLFPGVPHDVSAIEPDCRCDPAQPDLRAARFVRGGTECWLLVNEGEEEIETALTLPTDKPAGSYDLWTGRASRFTGTLRLPRRGSLLLFACGGGEYAALPEEAEQDFLQTPAFTLVSEDKHAVRKEYRASLTVTADQLARPGAVLELRAEEMAELYVNGRFAGVGFWPPQKFDLLPFLREGENSLRLAVTGSLANRYGQKKVPYGLM